MELILWRHAEARPAAPGEDDAGRELTGKGMRQAKTMAAWLKPRLPRDYRLLASPTRRTRQTAACLNDAAEICAELGPEATARRALKASGWPAMDGTVILVGHRPGLNRLAALLMTGRESEWEMRKGAIWWFQSREPGEPAFLRMVLRPRDLGR